MANEFDNQQMKQQKNGRQTHAWKNSSFQKKSIQNESLSQTQCLCELKKEKTKI